jgi:hypothetical protein
MRRNSESPQKITGALDRESTPPTRGNHAEGIPSPAHQGEITWAFRTGQGPEIRQWRRW